MAHYELSLTLAAVGRFQGALDEGKATLRLRPHHLDALNHAAICMLRSGGSQWDAEALFRRSPRLRRHLGSIQLQQALGGPVDLLEA